MECPTNHWQAVAVRRCLDVIRAHRDAKTRGTLRSTTTWAGNQGICRTKYPLRQSTIDSAWTGLTLCGHAQFRGELSVVDVAAAQGATHVISVMIDGVARWQVNC
jgi:hypothetical protein